MRAWKKKALLGPEIPLRSGSWQKRAQAFPERLDLEKSSDAPGQIRRNSGKNFREAISFAGSIGSLGRKHRRSAEKAGEILNFHAFDQENKGFLHSGCQIRYQGF